MEFTIFGTASQIAVKKLGFFYLALWERDLENCTSCLRAGGQLNFNDFVLNYQYPFPFQVHCIGIGISHFPISTFHLPFAFGISHLDSQLNEPFAAFCHIFWVILAPLWPSCIKCFQQQLFVLASKPRLRSNFGQHKLRFKLNRST